MNPQPWHHHWTDGLRWSIAGVFLAGLLIGFLVGAVVFA